MTETNTWKLDIFSTEFSYIKDENLRNLAKWLIEQLPDYFFKVAASSTGKYHPDYALGEGGLVRHTKAAVRIAVELLRIEQNKHLEQAHDYIIIALLLHDGWKHGAPLEDGSHSKYTVFEHPKVCADWLIELGNKHTELNPYLSYIAGLVISHMGEWNLNYQTGAVTLPKPSTLEQQFVHMCDYLASRKCLEFNETVEYTA